MDGSGASSCMSGQAIYNNFKKGVGGSGMASGAKKQNVTVMAGYTQTTAQSTRSMPRWSGSISRDYSAIGVAQPQPLGNPPHPRPAPPQPRGTGTSPGGPPSGSPSSPPGSGG